MSTISTATRLLLALSMLKGVGPAALRKTAMISGFEGLNIQELATSIPQIARGLANDLSWEAALEKAEKQITEAHLHHARILSPLDDDYPKLLAATKDDPFLLYVQGTLAKDPEQSVAIIGTRQPTNHGKAITARITQFFVEKNWSIVSGLAIGCDGIAHQAALDAGGHTVAVLAHGLHMIAPSQHKKLAFNILSAGGALISEYPFGQKVQNQQYVKRDLTQAGMAQGVVMVQSDIKGGSLHASRASLNYGRWLAVPYPTDKDRENNEPKVQANIMIADGTDDQRAEFLRCSPTALKHIKILRSRDDYLLMTKPSKDIEPIKVSPQIYTNDIAPELFITSPSGNIDASPNAECISADQLADIKPLPEVGLINQSNIAQDIKRPNGVNHRQLPFRKSSYERARCQVLLCDLSGALEITQMPSVDSGEYKRLEAQINNSSILVALSARLRYIQKQLSAIYVARHQHKQSESGDEDMLLLHFSVENLVAQMRRAADLLHLLKKAELSIESDLPTISCQASNCIDETDIQLANEEKRKKFDDMFLFEVLENLQDFFSLRVVPAPNKNLNCTQTSLNDYTLDFVNDVSRKHEITVVSISDLIYSFNRLIAKSLYAS